jgi:ribonuclease E
MGDHWKSLANKLGAPGVDAPSSEPAQEAPTRSPAPPAAPRERHVEIEPESHRSHEPPVAEAPAAPAADAAHKPEKSKRKSSWDTLTSFFGISSSAETETKVPEISSAAPAETDALSRPAGRGAAEGRRGQSRSEGRHERRHETPARGAEGRSPETRPTEARSAERSGEKLFGSRAPETKPAKPSALETLFGEESQEIPWEKPAPRRMVDDVSAWDDENEEATVSQSRRSDSFEEPLGEVGPEGEVLSEEDAEAPQRRRRRRRRGGRRDRETTREEAAGPKAAEESFGEDWEAPELLKPVASGDSWDEPASFEEQALTTEKLPAEELDEDAQPVRRSGRRRRRGRGRDRAEETVAGEVREEREVREPRPTREPREPRESREAREARESREPVSREAILRETGQGRVPREAGPEPTSGGERPRREGRGRGNRSAASEAPRREVAAVAADDIDDQVDSSLALELEGDEGPNRHPKIPTWADSLEAIISSNMENRRRGDQRGGPPRGRPRGSGGGGGGGGGSGGGSRR